ncbi:sensor histidine kinase [Streptomyces sp. NPDC054796]
MPRIPSRRARRPGSLRAKLTLSGIAMLATGIVVATCISLVGVKHYLMSAIDADLLRTRDGIEQARPTADRIAAIGTVAKLNGTLSPDDLGHATGGTLLFAAIGADGEATKVAGIRTDARQRALAAAVTDPAALVNASQPRDVHVDGRLHRATAVRLGDGQLVVLASSVSSVHKVMAKVVRLELAVGVVLMAGLGTASFFGARRRLRPLEDMVETASAIAEGSPDGEEGPDGLGLSRRVAAPPDKHSVSEVEQLRLALNAMLHQVEAAFLTREHAAAQLRRFVADASHELRTPLAAIRGYLQLYERGMLTEDEERTRALARMTAESERMARLVDELLALARLDQRPELRPRAVDVARLAEESLADLSAQQPERPVELTVDPRSVGEGEGCVALADEAVLRQVVGNLVANVRVHTPVAARLGVSVTRVPAEDGHEGRDRDGRDGGDEDAGARGPLDGERIVLRVADEGPGMAPQDAARIFDRFFRTGSAQGSGLGMSVVRAGAEAQGGTVHVATAPGAGLAVTVTLPAAPHGGPPDGEEPGNGSGESGQARLAASRTMVTSDSAPTRTGGPHAPAPRVT